MGLYGDLLNAHLPAPASERIMSSCGIIQGDVALAVGTHRVGHGTGGRDGYGRQQGPTTPPRESVYHSLFLPTLSLVPQDAACKTTKTVPGLTMRGWTAESKRIFKLTPVFRAGPNSSASRRAPPKFITAHNHWSSPKNSLENTRSRSLYEPNTVPGLYRIRCRAKPGARILCAARQAARERGAVS